VSYKEEKGVQKGHHVKEEAESNSYSYQPRYSKNFQQIPEVKRKV
jgi:hypothetical protein